MMDQLTMEFPNKDSGYTCPSCGLYVRAYTRKFNSNMAIALLTLYRNKVAGYVHLENYMIEHGYKRCGDASYLRFYGLIERMEGKRIDDSKRNGFYRLTGRGIMFCEGSLTVQEKFTIFNNSFEGFSGEEVGIKKVLGNKFNYQELFNGDQ